MTLPIHPLAGQDLPLQRHVRTQRGRRLVDVTHPEGWSIRLPVEWTDLGAPTCLSTTARGTVEALLQLAELVSDVREW